MKLHIAGLPSIALTTIFVVTATAAGEELCKGFGPQTPRDISSASGDSKRMFTLAPKADQMNLCNIHTHTNAEHKGPGFSIFAGDDEHGGYRCNESESLTAAELEDPANGGGPFQGIKPGDTIEVHWVYTSCDITPGEGLKSCMSDSCANPELRVEAQVFLVVNDKNALDFNEFTYDGHLVNGRHQAKSLPTGTGDPVTFAGSTTGSSYTQEVCSPFQVTWSVHPRCTKINVTTLYAWAENGNVFNEDHSHGVRKLITASELLAPID
jgi:hypothetical protein